MVEPCFYKKYDFSGDAFEVFQLFKDESHAFFLDSSLQNSSSGRFSFIGFDPFEIFEEKGKNSLESLRGRFKKYSLEESAALKNIPVPFFSGLVGYFSYDMGLHLEKIRLQAHDDLSLPDCFFGFYDSAIAIDHLEGALYVIATGLPEIGLLKEKKAGERLKEITRRVEDFLTEEHSESNDAAFLCENIDLACNLTKGQYENAVKRALSYIEAGDIYQVNLAQRFLFDARNKGFEIDPGELYGALRKTSPSGFGGYFNAGHFQILSSSPEQFLRLRNGIIHTRPMKGTRPRGGSIEADAQFQKELLASPKDKAELLMITDLERNDLGRVCRYGSVKVKEMRTLEEYQTVFQTTSSVEGVLEDGKDCFDAIEACFPSGSVTGCPKIRAMEIIEELEGNRRAFYTGSLGYISFSGEMDFNVLIRTLLVKDQKIYFNVGSGIVADSTWENEYEETLIKAKAMCQAIGSVAHARAEV